MFTTLAQEEDNIISSNSVGNFSSFFEWFQLEFLHIAPLKSGSPDTPDTEEHQAHRTMDTFQVVLEIFPICDYTCHLVISMHVLVISSLQKVADDKAMKAKKGGPKGKKDDGPAQNGETKTNEV